MIDREHLSNLLEREQARFVVHHLKSGAISKESKSVIPVKSPVRTYQTRRRFGHKKGI